jgi:tripartite-type tricarboxylate transporter receptor subunit TctC
LAGELFKLNTGTDVTHVPFGGGGAAVLAVLGGQVQLGIVALPTARAYLESGKLRAIAITSEKRSTASPEIPTFSESGFPGLEADQFMGILAPAGTPKPIITRLNTEIVKIINAPDVSKRLNDLGFLITGSTPEGFAQTIREETEKWGKVVKQAKIRVE